MAVFVAVVYALVSMLVGQMLVLVSLPTPFSAQVLWSSGTGYASWNYPGLLVTAPWGILALPFLGTITMVLVAAGVGLGMSVSVLLLVQFVRSRRRATGRPAAASTLAGLTPAMVALLTLGACCSTTAAATAGLAVVAQSTGTSLAALLANSWYVDCFQVAILYLALVAQEQLLRVYLLVVDPHPVAVGSPPSSERTLARPRAAASAVRALLVGSGAVWTLTVPAAWTTVDPFTAPAIVWLGWVFQHFLIGLFAIVIGLFPAQLSGAIIERSSRLGQGVVRAAVGLAGATIAVGMVPPVSGWGVHGLVNELLGSLGVPASLGGVETGLGWGAPLLLRWGLELVPLGAFALAWSWSPGRVAAWLRSAARSGTERPTERTTTPAAIALPGES